MKKEGGFTLVELLLSLAITGICLGLTLPLLNVQRHVWENETAVREEYETLSAAVQWLARDLQGAGYGWRGTPLSAAGEERISYVIPARDPGRFLAGREDLRRITASVKEGDLMYRIQAWDSLEKKWKRGSTHKLASDLRAVSFTALSAGGTPPATVAETAAVLIELAGNRSGTHRTYVSLRNGRRPAGGSE